MAWQDFKYRTLFTRKQSVQWFQDTPMALAQYLLSLVGFELPLYLSETITRQFLTTVVAIPQVPESSTLPFWRCSKKDGMPKEMDISIMHARF